jgi:hypothetical protein
MDAEGMVLIDAALPRGRIEQLGSVCLEDIKAALEVQKRSIRTRSRPTSDLRDTEVDIQAVEFEVRSNVQSSLLD